MIQYKIRNQIFVIVILVSVVLTIALIKLYNNNKLLRQENIELASKLVAINKKQKYVPVLVEDRSIISLGEEYHAALYLAKIFKKEAPIVMVGDFGEDEFNISLIEDTIAYDSTYNAYFYNNKPKEKGPKNWGGVVFIENNDTINKLYFQSSYHVK